MTSLSCEVYTRRMPFADMKLNVRKLCLQLSCQFRDHRVFRIKMVGINEIQSQFRRMLELVVLDIGSHIGITAGFDGAFKASCSRTAHDCNSVHCFSAVDKAKSGNLQTLLAHFKKC